MSSAVTSGLITGAIALLGGFAIGWATTVWRGNVEHGHWLRQQRYDSYSALLTAYEGYTDTVSQLTGPSRSETLPSLELLGQLNEVDYRVTQRRARLRLLGPPEVYVAARALDEAVTDLTGELRAQLKAGPPGTGKETDDLVEQVAVSHLTFVREAAKALGVPVDSG